MSDIQYDVLIIGGGPAGLSAAIKLKQSDINLRVCILEKGAYIGAHNLSGAVFDVSVLQELLPNHWQKAPLDTPVTSDRFYYYTSKHAYRLPTPRPMQNHGNYLISLGSLCQFLARHAEELGCDIYTGVAANNVLYDVNGQVMGVETVATGVDTVAYQPGMQIQARYTLLAEGCRGHISQQVMQHFNLRKNCMPQTYGLGMKEIWQVPSSSNKAGHVIHSIGWPLDHYTYGGSFIYYTSSDRISIGFVVGLDYKNSWLDPFQEFQRFKTHPEVKKLLNSGERLSYGARALNEGGWQSMPTLTYPGGALIGDAAGFLNVAQMKGIHTSMYSGILAAQAFIASNPKQYSDNFYKSKIATELYKTRNIRPGFRYGLFPGLALAAIETYITFGKLPWTLKHTDDALAFKLKQNKSKHKKLNYPKPDGKLTFDRASSVYLSNIQHLESQPCHLKFKQNIHKIPMQDAYFAPEIRYCPAGVYEINNDILYVNATNCLHCKTCDIKDPKYNILWTAPEGGSGPNYVWM